MWLLNLNRTPRLILICVLLGVVGALGAQLFLFLLQIVETHVLDSLGHYQTISVEAAHSMGTGLTPH